MNDSTAAQQNAHRSPALLRPGLIVSISMFVSGLPEVEDTTKRIPDDGVITMPFIGDVVANGVTMGEFTDQLTQKYSEFYVNPHVIAEFVLERSTIGNFIESPWGFVTVLGRVGLQGKVAIPPSQDMTISEAIQKAGGLATSAKDSAIVVTRKTADGQTKKLSVNLKAMGKRGAVDEDIRTMSGDIIFVPEEIF